MPVGVAEIDITPAEAIRLTGYGNREQPTGGRNVSACGPRHSRSVTTSESPLDSGCRRPDRRAARPSPKRLAKRLGEMAVRRGTGFVICATHTHTGPSLAGVLPYIFSVPASAPQQQVVAESYTLDARPSQLERVARAALAGRRPSRVSAGHRGAAGFAANRRVLEGRQMDRLRESRPGGAVDHDLPMLAVPRRGWRAAGGVRQLRLSRDNPRGPRQLPARRLARRGQGADPSSGIRAPSPWWSIGTGADSETRTLAGAACPTSSDTPRQWSR